jgi:hypothetical protein
MGTKFEVPKFERNPKREFPCESLCLTAFHETPFDFVGLALVTNSEGYRCRSLKGAFCAHEVPGASGDLKVRLATNDDQQVSLRPFAIRCASVDLNLRCVFMRRKREGMHFLHPETVVWGQTQVQVLQSPIQAIGVLDGDVGGRLSTGVQGVSVNAVSHG